MAFPIDDQAIISLSLPFDTKTCGYWVDGEDGDVGKFVIDTVGDYLARITFKYRTAEKAVTILVPKTGDPDRRCDNVPETISALVSYYKGKQYAFVGGLADENFIEIVTGDKHYRHTQGVPATIWNITHNLNKYPSVTITDTSGTEYEGEVRHTDQNNVVLTFSAAFAGYADLN